MMMASFNLMSAIKKPSLFRHPVCIIAFLVLIESQVLMDAFGAQNVTVRKVCYFPARGINYSPEMTGGDLAARAMIARADEALVWITDSGRDAICAMSFFTNFAFHTIYNECVWVSDCVFICVFMWYVSITWNTVQCHKRSDAFDL